MKTPQSIPSTVLTALVELANESSAPQRCFMEQLAIRNREPNAGSSNVEELKELGEDRQDAVAFFKKLNEIGCGKFFAGRRGRESRIEWKPYGAIQVAKAFLAAPSELPASDGTFSSLGTATIGNATFTDSNSEFHDHYFLLRPGLRTSLRLPLDLTKEEANRLAEFIRTLPF